MYRDPNVKKPCLYLDTEAVWMWWESHLQGIVAKTLCDIVTITGSEDEGREVRKLRGKKRTGEDSQRLESCCHKPSNARLSATIVSWRGRKDSSLEPS